MPNLQKKCWSLTNVVVYTCFIVVQVTLLLPCDEYSVENDQISADVSAYNQRMSEEQVAVYRGGVVIV